MNYMVDEARMVHAAIVSTTGIIVFFILLTYVMQFSRALRRYLKRAYQRLFVGSGQAIADWLDSH